jgi:hypothetical protein
MTTWVEWIDALPPPSSWRSSSMADEMLEGIAAALEARFPGGPDAPTIDDLASAAIGMGDEYDVISDAVDKLPFDGVEDRHGRAAILRDDLQKWLLAASEALRRATSRDIRELPDSPPVVHKVTFHPAFDDAPACVVKQFTKDEMDAMAKLRAASDRQLEAQAAPGQVERDVTSALVGYPLLYGRKTVRAAPSFEVTGPPMRGKCVGCGIDLDVLVANGKLGHVCNGRPPMDIDHLHKLVTACIDECEATNDTGPAYDELVAYLGECGFVSRTVVATAMAGAISNVVSDAAWKELLSMLGRGLVEACDIAESWGPKTSEAQQALFQDRIAELREMAVKFNATGDAQPDFVDVVFDGPPGHEAGRFVEVEDSKGNSISIGEWIDRKDGTWALRIPRAVQR